MFGISKTEKKLRNLQNKREAELELKLLKEEELKKKAVYALNLVTVSVSQIVDYQDLVVLEQEYDAILNNINLTNIIHDEPLLDVLKQILDVITFYKIQAKEKQFIEQEYQQQMKAAIWSAVPNIGLIVAGGNPITMAISLASQVGIGYMNYRKQKANLGFEKDKQMWQLEKGAIEQLNGLRRELFSTAWKLSDKYQFPDEYRLTEKQVGLYNQILQDPDSLRRFERLEILKNDFEAFSPFWYNLAHTAKEISDTYVNETSIHNEYKEKALSYYKKFTESYIELLREDVIYSSAAIEQIPLLIESEKNCEEQIRNLLAKATKFAGNNNDILQQIVFSYIYLKDYSMCQNVLRRLINEDYNTIMNAQILSKIYIRENKEADYKLLSKRVEGNSKYSYLLPWPKENTDSDILFYESQKENFCLQLIDFFEKLKQESVLKVLRLVSYFEGKTDEYILGNTASELAEMAVKTGISFSPWDFLEEYISYINTICDKIKKSEICDIFDNDLNIDGDTVEEVVEIITEKHLQKLKDDCINLCEDNDNSESNLELLFTQINWNNGENNNPINIFKNLFEIICNKIEKTEITEINGKILSDVETAINKLYLLFGWIVPFYSKDGNEVCESKALISLSNLGEDAKKHHNEINKKKDLTNTIIAALSSIELPNHRVRKTFEEIKPVVSEEFYQGMDKKPIAILDVADKERIVLYSDSLTYYSIGFIKKVAINYSYKNITHYLSRKEDELEITYSQDRQTIKSKHNSHKINPIISGDYVNLDEIISLLKKMDSKISS